METRGLILARLPTLTLRVGAWKCASVYEMCLAAHVACLGVLLRRGIGVDVSRIESSPAPRVECREVSVPQSTTVSLIVSNVKAWSAR